MRTLNARASIAVHEIEALMQHAKAQKVAIPEGADDALAQLWRWLWRAEVSDCSGVNPWRGEVMFGIDTSEKILSEAEKWGQKLKTALGAKFVRIDLQTGKVEALNAKSPSPSPKAADAPIAVTAWADERTIALQWSELAADTWELEVAFGKVGSHTCTKKDKDACDPRTIGVGFPRHDDNVRYSPGLIEDDVRTYKLADWTWQMGEIWLPLANGLVGLGPKDGGQWWAIKDTRRVHIAARVKPDVPRIDFEDAAIQPPVGHSWRFVVFKGSEADALALANRINLHPVTQR